MTKDPDPNKFCYSLEDTVAANNILIAALVQSLDERPQCQFLRILRGYLQDMKLNSEILEQESSLPDVRMERVVQYIDTVFLRDFS